MKLIKTKLKDLYIIQPKPFYDNRGSFGRIYCRNELKEIGHKKDIVQMNQSLTKEKGTIRGMHFQFPPKAEIKILKCILGTIFDVAVDLRSNSSTFLKWHGEILSEDNMKMMYIPEGFAHGFQTLEDNCQLLYLHTEFYSQEHESGVRYDDPLIDIGWPIEISNISERDKNFSLLTKNFEGIIL